MTVRELITTCNNRILSYELNITSIVAVKPIRQCATHNIAIGMNDLFEQYGDREVKTFCINKTKMLIEISDVHRELKLWKIYKWVLIERKIKYMRERQQRQLMSMFAIMIVILIGTYLWAYAGL